MSYECGYLFTCKLAVGQAIDRTAGCRSGEVRSRTGVRGAAVFEEKISGRKANIERQGIIDRLNSGRELYIQKGGRLGWKPGSRNTAEQRKEEYREAIALLKKGYSIRNVAKFTGKAVSTIQQVKKDLINS